ncbi:Putative protein ImpD [Photobacterium marinum]|uniref:Type VI secretion system contractile sheath large subunit n=1 Tax=Photobacterium marinum TaxID=1056511 RepID=L8J6W3_9GAMM|nr:type VI secretion system contractile sheath large subunit [Photobacterium marinum]ELR64600.1 Putative protein ImpD [Photobacterium marinum]
MESAIRFIDTEDLETVTNKLKDGKSDLWFSESDVVDQFLSQKDPYWAIRIWLEKDNVNFRGVKRKEDLIYTILKSINDIDNVIDKQLNEIVHCNCFKKIEASWRGLNYIVSKHDKFDKDRTCKIKLLNLSWKELSRDIKKAIEFDQSEIFRLIYGNEFSMPGGEPFGLLIGDYHISHKSEVYSASNDIDTLKGVSQVAAASFAPFITSAKPSFFGVDYFAELAGVRNINNQFSLPEYRNWQSLREMDDARFLGIAIPDMLMRKPYERDGTRRDSIKFDENRINPHRDYLWGNAAYGFAVVAIKAFSESGWFSQIRGMNPGRFNRGLVFDLPIVENEMSAMPKSHKSPVNLQVGDKLEKELSDSGFMPLSIVPDTGHLVFFSNASVNIPRIYDLTVANANARISSMLQYVMCVSRFAHYIKVMGRDKLGGYESAESIERDFQKWLLNYTTASNDLTEDVNARYPLNEASIKVKETPGKPGSYYSIIRLRPHFQLDQLVSSIRLVTELSPGVHYE